MIGWESEHALRGPRQVQAIETPYGRLSSVICLDMEYPDFIRQAGQQGVDIMLAGAIDGTPATLGTPSTSSASYRAIENGFSLARAGLYGENVAVDYQGRFRRVRGQQSLHRRRSLGGGPPAHSGRANPLLARG